jgi:prephenate dehydrogenase
MKPIQQLAIIGVGLIGTSLALAAKRSQPGLHVIGIDRDGLSLEQARARGAIDECVVVENLASLAQLSTLAACDAIALALPVRQFPEALASLAAVIGPQCVVFDVGSTKADVLAAAQSALGAKFPQFVGCHPIAGRERHGPLAADVTLFEGKNVIVCAPQATTDTVDLVTVLWQSVGARVAVMSPDAHDAVFAAVSHLPHMLAYALVDELASRPDARTLFAHAASGFRDFTRIASSSPEMWRDIALNNRTALLAELDAYLARVQSLRDSLAKSDADALTAMMQRAQAARERWLSGQLDQFNQPPQSSEES